MYGIKGEGIFRRKGKRKLYNMEEEGNDFQKGRENCKGRWEREFSKGNGKRKLYIGKGGKFFNGWLSYKTIFPGRFVNRISLHPEEREAEGVRGRE